MKWTHATDAQLQAAAATTDNDYTTSIASPVQGEAFVPYWKAPRTPIQTYYGEALGPPDDDDQQKCAGSCAADVDLHVDKHGHYRLAGGFDPQRPASLADDEAWFIFPAGTQGGTAAPSAAAAQRELA